MPDNVAAQLGRDWVSASIEPSRFLVATTHVVPPLDTVAAVPGRAHVTTNAVVPASAAALPALRSVQPLTAASYILPGAACSGWLVSVGLAWSQGASLPLIAAVTAAGVASVAVMGRELAARWVSGPRPPAPPSDPTELITHFNYATDTAADANLRVDHAAKYANLAVTVPGADAERLFGDLPRGSDWGVRNGQPKMYGVLKTIGLTQWSSQGWSPFDLEAVIVGLSKLGPVTESQRANIEKSAMEIVKRSQGRDNKRDAYLAELDAAVRELVRRAPKATAAAD